MLELVLPCITAGAQNLTIFFFWKTSWIKQMPKHSRSWYPECSFLLSKRKNKNCIVFLNCRVITMENKESLMHSLNSKYIWKSFIKHSEQNKRKCVNVRNDAIWFHGPWTPTEFNNVCSDFSHFQPGELFKLFSHFTYKSGSGWPVTRYTIEKEWLGWGSS